MERVACSLPHLATSTSLTEGVGVSVCCGRDGHLGCGWWCTYLPAHPLASHSGWLLAVLLSHSVIPPHFPKGHAFEAHTGDATLDAAVPCDDWFVAAAYGRLKLLEVAAEVVDVNLRSHLHPFETPLHVAAGEGHAHVVRVRVLGDGPRK